MNNLTNMPANVFALTAMIMARAPSAEKSNPYTMDLYSPICNPVLSAERTVCKQSEGANIIGRIERKIDQLALELVQVEEALYKRNENTVSAAMKPQKRKRLPGCSVRHGEIVGWLQGVPGLAGLLT